MTVCQKINVKEDEYQLSVIDYENEFSKLLCAQIHNSNQLLVYNFCISACNDPTILQVFPSFEAYYNLVFCVLD